jgi:3-methyladenine DNA glycosylase AlkD
MAIDEIRARLQRLGNRQSAQALQRFFKTGPGEYGESDLFYGVRAPELRKLAREYQSIPAGDVRRLLKSPFHEERLLALLVLMRVYARGDQTARKSVYETYLGHTPFINNWDLVDVSAPHIVGDYLLDKSRKPLYLLARSSSLWERRIAIVATFRFIRRGEILDTLRISEILLLDEEDLIHKAVGWMLREAGKRDLAGAEDFLKKHYRTMPRTMLRYAIEKFPESRRQMYLTGRI